MNHEPHKPSPFPPNTTTKGRDFDPHLREVMHEIKELLEHHQVAAYVALQSPHYAEYLVSIPPWACITISPQGEVRIYAKREQFPSREAQVDCVTSSTGMIFQFQDMLRIHSDMFGLIVKKLGDHFDVSHISKHTSE